MLFCRKICSFEIYAVLLQNLFCRDLRTFYVEKNLAKNVVRGEKMTNKMYAMKPIIMKQLCAILKDVKLSLRQSIFKRATNIAPG